MLAMRVLPIPEKIIKKKFYFSSFENLLEAHGTKFKKCVGVPSEKEVSPASSHTCP